MTFSIFELSKANINFFGKLFRFFFTTKNTIVNPPKSGYFRPFRGNIFELSVSRRLRYLNKRIMMTCISFTYSYFIKISSRLKVSYYTLLNVARYITTSLRGPAQTYTNERASASLGSL